jgi:hypothetical protein
MRKSLAWAKPTRSISFVDGPISFQGETDWACTHYLAWNPSGEWRPCTHDRPLGPAEPADKIVAKVRRDIAQAAGPEGLIKRDGEEQVSSSLEKVMAELGSKKKYSLPIAPHVRSAKQLSSAPTRPCG